LLKVKSNDLACGYSLMRVPPSARGVYCGAG
jgi:hypothetical protein